MYARLIGSTSTSRGDFRVANSCWFYGRSPEGGICVLIGQGPIPIPER